MAEVDTSDRYASSKANLRENVKWLATSFAGMAALLLAGTPFTGFGSLPVFSLRFLAAILGLAIATVCAFIAWQRLLDMLRPDATYTHFFRTGVDPESDSSLTEAEKKEYVELKKEFEKRKPALLPDRIATFERLEAANEEAWAAFQASPHDQGLKDIWIYVDGNIRNIEDWAAYTRLHSRCTAGIDKLWIVAILMLLALSVFAYAANPPQQDSRASEDRVIVDQSTRNAEPVGPDVSLDPVYFDPGKATIDESGRSAIQRVRDSLREFPDSALLLMAHTDTTAAERVNIPLAAQRAAVVRDSLINEGGIAPSRIFVATLPEGSLPVVTGEDSSKQENRAVYFELVPRVGRIPPSCDCAN